MPIAFKYYLLLWLVCSGCLLGVNPIVRAQPALTNMAMVLQIDGAIGPAIQDYIHRGMQQAQVERSKLIVLQIDTPGGLDKSMRGIVADMLASPIPVIAYVAPSGARAASAGTYIVYASQIAAMAPGTHLGAATPVDLADVSQKTPKSTKPTEKTAAGISAEKLKMLNDSRAYLRSLAQLRGRNADWAELAVTKAASLSATEALKQHVIDYIAGNIPELLLMIQGKTVQVAGGQVTIPVDTMQTKVLPPDWRTRFLAVITDPSIAYILLMIGFYGLLFEFFNPGMILPGVVGTISLLIGLYALQLLPINYAGLMLILLGMIFISAESFIPSYGSLGIGGAIAFLIGSILLLKTSAPGFSIPLQLIITVTAITLLVCFAILQLAWRARKRPVVTGAEAMVGQLGEVIIDNDGQLWVYLLGERWQAQSAEPLYSRQQVKVIAVNGLVLEVMPVVTTSQ